MTDDNDQATVDRLCLLTYTSDQEGEPHDCVECADAARAIIDAIRKGEVPGVVTDDMIQTTKLMVYEAAMEEIVALRAEVERLKAYSEAADKALELACKTRSAAVDVLKIVNIQRDKWMERADKATADRDRLAGLLGDIGHYLENQSAYGTQRLFDLRERINAAREEVGK